MTLPTSGTITLAMIQTEFGGPSPIALSRYYRGGAYVPNTTTNANVPTGGAIALSQFYGASATAFTPTGSISGGGTHRSSSATGFEATFNLTATTDIPSPTYTWSASGNGIVTSSSGANATVQIYIPPQSSDSTVVTCVITNGTYSVSPTTTCTGLSTYCFSGNVRILTDLGYVRFDELPPEFTVVNHTGKHRAQLLVHENCTEPMRRMGDALVTERHLIKVGSLWVPAKDLFHESVIGPPMTVYNIHVLSDNPDDHHYILENGLTAHNIKP